MEMKDIVEWAIKLEINHEQVEQEYKKIRDERAERSRNEAEKKQKEEDWKQKEEERLETQRRIELEKNETRNR